MNYIFRLTILLIITLFGEKSWSQNVPIWFSTYKIKITNVTLPSDTFTYQKSNSEIFKFVFYDKTGKSYCERYLDGKLVEKGFFTSTQEPSELLYSARSSRGKSKPIKKVESYMPLKNGEWQVYENDKLIRTEIYLMGALQN